MEGLTLPDVLRIATVLEDSLDQLSILGHIMPVSYMARPDVSQIVEKEIGNILKSQKQLVCKFGEVMLSRTKARHSLPPGSSKVDDLGQQVQEVGGEFNKSSHLFTKSTLQNPLTADNLKKVQADRQFVNDVLAETLLELKNKGTFDSLLRAVSHEKEKKHNFQETVTKEDEGRKRVKELQKQLIEIQKEKDVEVQNRNEMIAHLKDQLQEMKAKTNMEEKYVKKDADLQVFQTQRKCQIAEEELKEELQNLHASKRFKIYSNLQKLKEKSDEEMRVHMEIESFLRQLQQELEEKLEYWMEKHDKDTEAKQQELNALKAAKAANLAQLQELAKQYREFETVVIEDRLEKERLIKERDLEKRQMKSVVKIQAWWRGTMVRKRLGPYAKLLKTKKENGKDKKGKKAGKKKKKKKK